MASATHDTGGEVAIELPADEADELDAAIDASGIEPSYSVEEVMEELRSERGKQPARTL